MVFAGIYPVEGSDYPLLRDALERFQLNDASLFYEPETSNALGFGFRCGFLGLLHMEIIQERLEREYNLDILATAPSVEYYVTTTDGEVVKVDNPSDFPSQEKTEKIEEPWMDISIFTPTRYIGTIMDLVTTRRGTFKEMKYIEAERVLLNYQIPLAELITDFYDQLKSRTQGYASLDYSFGGYQKAVRKDVLAKCYGGDITRKRKLLEKQKEGKKRLKMVGNVEIPQEAFMSILSLGD